MGLKYYLRGLGVGIIVTALIMGIATRGDSRETLSDDEIRKRAEELGMVEESTVLADTFAQGSANLPAEEEGSILTSVPDNDGVDPTQGEATPTPEGEKAAESSEGEEADEDMAGETAAGTSASPEATAGAKDQAPTPSAAEKEAVPTATPTPAPMAEPAQSPSAAPSPTATPAAESTPELTATVQRSESVTIQIASGDSSFTICKKLAEAGLVKSASGYDAYLCQNGYDKSIHAGTFEIPVGASEEEIAGIILKLR